MSSAAASLVWKVTRPCIILVCAPSVQILAIFINWVWFYGYYVLYTVLGQFGNGKVFIISFINIFAFIDWLNGCHVTINSIAIFYFRKEKYYSRLNRAVNSRLFRDDLVLLRRAGGGEHVLPKFGVPIGLTRNLIRFANNSKCITYC